MCNNFLHRRISAKFQIWFEYQGRSSDYSVLRVKAVKLKTGRFLSLQTVPWCHSPDVALVSGRRGGNPWIEEHKFVGFVPLSSADSSWCWEPGSALDFYFRGALHPRDGGIHWTQNQNKTRPKRILSVVFGDTVPLYDRSRQPRGIIHELHSLAWTLWSWVRIPLKAWVYGVYMCLCCPVFR
jgi:hypothetical protein